MRRLSVQIDINAPRQRVWAAIENIATHTQWMRDAEAIRFTSAERQGTGTTFECDTRVGPFRTTDRMQVTEWRPGERMAIRHTGAVTGNGVFDLVDLPGGRTRFEWTEQLEFPRRRGGDVAGFLLAPVLRRIWKGNLERLRDLVERG